MSSFDEDGSYVDLGPKSVAIVGAGLVGCLLGVYLRKHGYSVSFYESRGDPRAGMESGRSINLVITSRGIHALTSVSPDLAEKVMAVTTRVQGRTLHDKDGKLTYQSYGPDSSFCNFSVCRWKLNCVLLSAAEEAGCR
jgi:kynurenine 3-monooxygenase